MLYSVTPGGRRPSFFAFAASTASRKRSLATAMIASPI
jgi:hypothetical protein